MDNTELVETLEEAKTKADNLHSRWVHRKAEWICGCGEHNFVDREQCRQCGKKWHAKLELIPAGSPPPPRKPRGEGGMTPAVRLPPPRTADSPEEAEVEAARTALKAAQEAHLGEAVLKSLEEEVTRKQRALETVQGKHLPKRFSEATQKEKETRDQLTKAERALEAAKTAVETARQAHQDASARLAAVKEEIKLADEDAKPAEEAKEDISREALANILKAYRQAAAPGATTETKATLEEALKAAEATAVHEELQAAKAKEAETAKPAAIAVDRAEAAKRKGADDDFTATQPGTEDLTDGSLDELLRGIPAGKRQRALDRLTQLGVGDA